MKKNSAKKKIIVILTVFLCTVVGIILYHISDAFVKLPDYNGFDEETLADTILIERSFGLWGSSGPVLAIFGDGRIYSFYYPSEDFDKKKFSEDYEYRKTFIWEHWKLEPIRVSRRDLKRILQYTPYIDPDNYEKEFRRFDGGTSYTEIYDHVNQRKILLEEDGSYLIINTSPKADALIKLVDKYDNILYYYYKIMGGDAPPHFQNARKFWYY